jgi:4-methylaminobutanoate oxidase (formaldehyde-forming)
MPDIPTQAQVVIIGGGVAGCSIAYHLTKMGSTDVLVLDRNELTSGSTFHSAGLVGQLRTDVNLTRMIQYSTELYRRLKDETGVEPDWREVGSLRLASSPERMEELRRLTALSHSFGLPLELISPKEAQDLFPVMSLEGVLGAVYLPTDGYIDPNGLTQALAAGARSHGANFLTHTLVQTLELKNGRIHKVTTDRGDIETEIVVNATGQWAGEISRMVGVYLPIIPMEHEYILTRPIPEQPSRLPTMRDPDWLIYYREEVGGLLMGGYERKPMPWSLKGIPAGFNSKLLAPDWDRFMPIMENAIRRTPQLETAEVAQMVNGPEAFTPDSEFLLGPTDVPGFWVAAGFCAHGLAGAGGTGKVMAEWIIDGQPEWNVWRLDLRRFGKQYASQGYTLEKTLETYSMHYDIHFPNEERSAGRPLRISPFYHRLQALGASFGEKAGWERPNWYTSNESRAEHGHEPRGWARRHWSPAIGVEHLATRRQAGLFDETSFSKIDVRGPDALPLLGYLCANDVDRPVGHIIYTAMLNSRGGIECDVTVLRLADEHFRITTGSAFGRHDLAWIRINTPPNMAVQIEDVTSNYACLGLFGPRARDILARATQDDVSNAHFPYMRAKQIVIGAVPALALRVTYVGELGWEIYCPMEYGQRLWDILWGSGQEDGMVAAGYRAIDTLRLEKGYRYWSTDVGPDYTPYEAGLGFAVKLDKGDFIGREALLKQKKAGIQRKLCCLVLAESSAIVLGNEPIHDGDEVVGWLSSGGYGYAVEKSIAFGYLPMRLTAANTSLTIDLFGERKEAIVVEEPLWDAAGSRIRA